MPHSTQFDIESPDDYFDSRSVIERHEDLNSEREHLEECVDDAREDYEAAKNDYEAAKDDGDESEIDSAEKDLDRAKAVLDTAERNLEQWDDADEWEKLDKFVKECEDSVSDWSHGAHFIADHKFEEHAQELAEDTGAIDRNAKWPLNCIDWKQAARELQSDYDQIEVDGRTYWVRA